MTIVCLGWGSLIEHPGDLPVVGAWHADGPALPIEFARESRDGRMTLVLADHDRPVPVLWTELDVPALNAAHTALQTREGAPWSGSIGRWPIGQHFHAHADEIGTWAARKNIAGVVWTNLKPGMRADRDAHVFEVPSLARIKQHLERLNEEQRNRATEYIRTTPAQIVTPYRESLERLLAI